MNPKRVLVAFSSRSGSTAGAAEVIAAVLRSAGFAVDCRPKEEVADLTPYGAVVLGSGMYVARRASDGGGFLERHASALGGRDLWLFSAGPIGGHAASNGEERAVFSVARAVNARGVATFGAIGDGADGDAVASLIPAGRREIRIWAEAIAGELGTPAAPVAPRRHRCHGAAAAG